jgi:hypothetical protein
LLFANTDSSFLDVARVERGTEGVLLREGTVQFQSPEDVDVAAERFPHSYLGTSLDHVLPVYSTTDRTFTIACRPDQLERVYEKVYSRWYHYHVNVRYEVGMESRGRLRKASPVVNTTLQTPPALMPAKRPSPEELVQQTQVAATPATTMITPVVAEIGMSWKNDDDDDD